MVIELKMLWPLALLWAGTLFLLYLMRRDRHEPTPDFVQTALLMMALVLSVVLLLLLWGLA